MGNKEKTTHGVNNTESRNGTQEQEKLKNGWGYRHQQCLILFLCLTTAYSVRACMGVALVAMTGVSKYAGPVANQEIGHFKTSDNNFSTNVEYTTHENLTDNDKLYHDDVLDKEKPVKTYTTFNWTKKVQDTILSSFFWGYMALQIPGGMLVHRYGSKYLLVASLCTNSALFLVLPWTAYYGGWVCIMILRVVQGMSQACIFPSIHSFFGKWAPVEERGRMSALVYGGQALGTVLGLPITGFIASSSLGWPGIFWFYGTLCGCFGVVIYFFLADTPATHPKISASERKYIEDDLGDNKTTLTVPWKAILTSKGVWASVCSHIGQSWGGTILFSEIPFFMDKVMGVNIKANGVLTALPFLVMWIANFLFSQLSDIVINRNLLSVTNTRKFMNCLGSGSAAMGLLGLCFVPRDIFIVEPLLIIICSFKIAAHMGFQVINIDIAPNFAGTIMSISNFCANGISSFGPVVTGFLVTDPTNPSHWNRVFLLTAGLYFISNLAFVIFASAEKADWNNPNNTNKKEEKDIEQSEPMVQR